MRTLLKFWLYPLLLISTCYLNLAYAAEPPTVRPTPAYGDIVKMVPALKGGLDQQQLERCQQYMQNRCSNIDSPMALMNCKRKELSQNDSCKQNLALLNEADILAILHSKHYPNVTVIDTQAVGADHSNKLMMITHQGELISLAYDFDKAIERQFPKTHARFPQATVFPVAVDSSPKAVKLPNHGLRLIIHQRVPNGCMACEDVAIADVGYDFDDCGTLLDVKLLELTPPKTS